MSRSLTALIALTLSVIATAPTYAFDTKTFWEQKIDSRK